MGKLIIVERKKVLNAQKKFEKLLEKDARLKAMKKEMEHFEKKEKARRDAEYLAKQKAVKAVQKEVM